MIPHRKYLEQPDEALLSQCDVHVYKASGPGGQHRNKVSSAVRLKHRPSGISAYGDDSRSQHENKRLALRRLRMNLACRQRIPVDLSDDEIPSIVRECMFRPRGRGPNPGMRLEVGRKDYRFWTVIAWCLDVLHAREGKLSEAAAVIGITTSNLVSLFKSDRHALGALQNLRKEFGQNPIH